RKQEEAYKKAAQERITLASNIKKRKFEDLREEERTIVYRNLVKSLMTNSYYSSLPDYTSGFKIQHILSELINSIFDIDKMLYFVAPEWWTARVYNNSISIGDSSITESINGSIVNWPDKPVVSKIARPEGYYIT